MKKLIYLMFLSFFVAAAGCTKPVDTDREVVISVGHNEYLPSSPVTAQHFVRPSSFSFYMHSRFDSGKLSLRMMVSDGSSRNLCVGKKYVLPTEETEDTWKSFASLYESGENWEATEGWVEFSKDRNAGDKCRIMAGTFSMRFVSSSNPQKSKTLTGTFDLSDVEYWDMEERLDMDF